MIARRVADAHRKLPEENSVYESIKDSIGRKSYAVIDTIKPKIIQLLGEAMVLNCTQGFIEYCLNIQKR
ncbi:hypothetical protein ACE1TI_14535 [Alteribacillus sp. JSM 102045]|uniref:hypothetical protein n=1 Tax=Alteribacillus sp. JSM 102045 TaxID=1562101 RepID=UPI0035BED621